LYPYRAFSLIWVFPTQRVVLGEARIDFVERWIDMTPAVLVRCGQDEFFASEGAAIGMPEYLGAPPIPEL
jgi:hypothetical protein